MKGGGQSWMKLYTSLLYHEGFAGLSESQQMTIIALWLYAAVSGHHILPADPKWLFQRIPLLKGPPDLKPLAEAIDAFGNHNPFIRFCEQPKAKKSRSKKSQQERERERERDSREKNPTGSRKKDREKKDGLSPENKQTAEQRKAEKPEDPKESDMVSDFKKESDVAPASLVHLPRPALSAFNRRKEPQRLGSVLNDWLPEHWRDEDCRSFGWEIVEVLGYEKNERSTKIRSEWGSFAAFWLRVKNKASPLLLAELRAKAIEKALFVNSPKVKTARNKSAVWFDIMYSELDHHGIYLPRKSRSG